MKSIIYNLIILFTFGSLGFCLSACEKQTQTGTPTSKSKTKNKRVITFSPALTQIVRKLGKEKLLVGVDQYSCQYLPDKLKSKLKSAGNMIDVNSEIFISLNPTHIIFQTLSPKRLEHVKTVVPNAKIDVIKINNLDDITNAVQKVGEILDAKPQADKIIAKFETNKKLLKGIAKKSPRVLFMNADYGYMCAGRGTFIGDLLDISGAKNAAAEIVGTKFWKNAEVETIIKASPEIIIMSAMKKNVPKLRQFWSKQIEIPAVKNGRVYFVTDSRWNLPGAEYSDIIPELIKILTDRKDQ